MVRLQVAEPTEIGKLLPLLALARVSLGLVTDAAYKYIYQATLATVPATYRYIGVCFFVLDLAVVIYLHVDMNRNTADEQSTKLANIEH